MIECLEFKADKKGSLIGFATLKIDNWDLVFNKCPVFEKDGRRWVSFPTFPTENDDGSRAFTPYFSFSDPKKQTAFKEQANEAISHWFSVHNRKDDHE